MVGRTDTVRTPLAEGIRTLRNHFDETQEEFAKRVNVTVGSIARYETNAHPSRRVLTRLKSVAIQGDRLDLVGFFNSILSVEHQDKELIALKFAFGRFVAQASPVRMRKMRQLLKPELCASDELGAERRAVINEA